MSSSVRRLLPFTALLLAIACGDTGSGCAACGILDEHREPATEVLHDGAQVYLAPKAFSFITENFDEVLLGFLPSGLVFDVPTTRIETLCVPLLGCVVAADICKSGPGCKVTAEVGEPMLGTHAPDRIAIDAKLSASGLVDIRGRPDCDIPLHLTDKPISAEVKLLVDPVTDALSFEIGEISASISGDDFSIEGGFLCSVADLGFVKNYLANTLNAQLDGQIRTQIETALEAMTCLPCNYYASGCPSGSKCGGSSYCRHPSDGACVAKYQGLDGVIDPSVLLSSLALTSPAERLRVTVAPGQELPATIDPLIETDNGGLRVSALSAVSATKSACVPECEAPDCIPPFMSAAPRVDFDAEAVRLAAPDYMLGIGVSDRLLDKTVYELWRSGALCLSLDSTQLSVISTSTFSSVVGSLATLTEKKNAPMKVILRPNRSPSFGIGAGTYVTDPSSGEQKIDEALLTLSLHDLAIDFYAFVAERWFRLFTLTVDIDLPLGLDISPNNELVPILGDLNNAIHMVTTAPLNAEILAEDPAALRDLLPTILGLTTPALAASLGAIALPDVQGFRPSVRAIGGIMARPGSPGTFEHLGIFADLELATPKPFTLASPLRLELSALDVPKGEARAGRFPETLAYVDVEAPPGPAREVQFRVDGGLWSTWRPMGRLVITHPVLRLAGRHQLEVRSRVVGDPRSLDPIPGAVVALVDFTSPQLFIERAEDGAVVALRAEDDVTAADRLRFRFAIDGREFEAAPAQVDLSQVEWVEVSDEAGNVERRTLIEPARFAIAESSTGSASSAAAAPEATGCAAAGTAPFSLLALFALTRLRRRRGPGA